VTCYALIFEVLSRSLFQSTLDSGLFMPALNRYPAGSAMRNAGPTLPHAGECLLRELIGDQWVAADDRKRAPEPRVVGFEEVTERLSRWRVSGYGRTLPTFRPLGLFDTSMNVRIQPCAYSSSEDSSASQA
jgi:hypothetical protein